METIKCTSCGEGLLSTDKFCKHCGTSTEQIAKCTSCGETVLSTDKFCTHCGKPNGQKAEQTIEQNTEQATEQKTETAAAAESSNKEEYDEQFKLYSLWSIVAATFLGGPLAAGILIRKNSLNLGYRDQEGLICLIVGIIATLLIIILPLEKVSIPVLIPLVYAGITYLIVKKMHGQILETHKEEGNQFYSHGKVVGIALICGVITIAGIFSYYYFTDQDSNFGNNNPKLVLQNDSVSVYQIRTTDMSAYIEQTEYYKHYRNTRWGDEDIEDLNVKIIFGKKEITVVAPETTNTFIIVGSPETISLNALGYITYNVYYSNDIDREIMKIERIIPFYTDKENSTRIYHNDHVGTEESFYQSR